MGKIAKLVMAIVGVMQNAIAFYLTIAVEMLVYVKETYVNVDLIIISILCRSYNMSRVRDQ